MGCLDDTPHLIPGRAATRKDRYEWAWRPCRGRGIRDRAMRKRSRKQTGGEPSPRLFLYRLSCRLYDQRCSSLSQPAEDSYQPLQARWVQRKPSDPGSGMTGRQPRRKLREHRQHSGCLSAYSGNLLGVLGAGGDLLRGACSERQCGERSDEAVHVGSPCALLISSCTTRNIVS